MAACRIACRTILTIGYGAPDLFRTSSAHSVQSMEDASPDHDERLKDFFARHGGPAPRGIRRGQSSGGVQGWSEAFASDGYVLRCDWSTFGTLDEMKYSEIAPKPLGRHG
jgi:hypothetical protein